MGRRQIVWRRVELPLGGVLVRRSRTSRRRSKPNQA